MDSCEAMVPAGRYWMACGFSPVETHHKLTRARGGLLLDAVGEDHHLIKLCHVHHMYAHGQGGTYESGLMMRGYVISGVDGQPMYVGPDKYLSEKYPRTLVREAEQA